MNDFNTQELDEGIKAVNSMMSLIDIINNAKVLLERTKYLLAAGQSMTI